MIYSWVGWLNFLLLQWIGLRIVKFLSTEGRVVALAYHWPVVPLTGWWGEFIPPSPVARGKIIIDPSYSHMFDTVESYDSADADYTCR